MIPADEANDRVCCQIGGRLLADLALLRLLHQNWPRTLEELEILMHKKEVRLMVSPRLLPGRFR